MSGALHWDATFPMLRLEGKGALRFLQGQTSADLMSVSEGVLLQSCWLSTTGRLQALLEIRLDSCGADVLVLAGDDAAVARGFDRVIFPADGVRLQPIRMQRRIQSLDEGAATAWLEQDAAVPENWCTGGAADDAALEQWRVREGCPPGPGELNGDTNPLELGLIDRVSTKKGCYLGQETMAKLISRAGVKQKLRHWHCDQVLKTGAELQLGDDRVGSVTSSIETDAGWIGLALVRRKHLEAGEVHGPEGQAVQLSRPRAFQDPPE